MRAVAIAFAVAALAWPIPARAELYMEPGQWEAIMTVGGNEMPPDRKCYTQKDVDNLDRFQRGESPTAGNPCTTSGYSALGNTMSYTLTCTINGKRTVSAVTMSYDRTRIAGEITGVDGTQSRLINTRIGDCSKSSFGE